MSYKDTGHGTCDAAYTEVSQKYTNKLHKMSYLRFGISERF